VNKLTAKQKKFVAEYVKDLNATQAAIRAGYSEKTANEQAARLLVNVSIQNALQATQKKVAKEDLIDALYIKQQSHQLYLQCAGLAPIKKLINKDGVPISVEVREFNGPAANKAIENLGKHVDIQAFKESLKIEGEIDMLSPLIAARKRIESRNKQ